MYITTLQIAIAGGMLVGLGATLLVARLMPVHVDSKWAIEQLDPIRTTTQAVDVQTVSGLQNQLGLFIERRAPARLWTRVPQRELALLQRPVHVHLGEKALLAIVGLMFPPLFMVVVGLLGLQLPVVLPVAASLGLAALFWTLPDLRIRGEAKAARREFVRALATYIDLVALERASGAGTSQSLESAAKVGDSWVFKRIKAAIDQAEWTGRQPWDGLKDLSDELEIPEIGDLAEIMRLSREQGSTVYEQLRARASSMRNALLSEDLAKAAAAAEQLSVPVSMLALIFLAILGSPAILRIMG